VCLCSYPGAPSVFLLNRRVNQCVLAESGVWTEALFYTTNYRFDCVANAAGFSTRLIGMHAMDAGIVDFYNAERGFGYIRPKGGDPDVRVEFEVLRVAGIRMLEQGQSVQFSTTENAVTGKITVDAIMLGE